MAKITVHKFGGGVLKNAEDFQRIAKILKAHGTNQVAVVSAVYGVTNQIESILKRLLKNGESLESFSEEILLKHVHILESIYDEELRKKSTAQVMDSISRLNKVLFGAYLLQEVTPRTIDLVHSFGERISQLVFTAFLLDEGVFAQNLNADDAGLITTANFGNALPIMQECRKNLQKTILPLAEKGIVVFTGYFGKTTKGHVTTLGRGGSDFSAGIVANCLNAEKLLVWKDVQGFMTADPKVVTSAELISTLTYKEAEELGAFGAQILHPRSMAPLAEKNIPVEIKSVFHPEKIGTIISNESRLTKSVVKSAAVKKNACLVTLHGESLLSVSSLAYALFEELQKHDLPIDVIATSQSDLSLCFEEKYVDEFEKALERAKVPASDVSIQKDISLIGVVGEGMNHTIGVAGRLFSCLAKSNVNIRMISQGASEINITVAVARHDVDIALKAAHTEFIENVKVNRLETKQAEVKKT